MNNNHLVVKSNALIECKTKMTALEQKIIGVLASEISPCDEDFKDYEFSIKEFINLAGTNETAIYKQIHESARRLMQKIVTFKRGNRTVTTAFLSSATTIDGEGKIILRFDPSLKPELLNLKKIFTEYRLEHILKLKSSHSIRIYELLKQYERIRKRELEIDEFKSLLGIGEGYDRFYDFERYVLEPAKAEINEKTDIAITYSKIKSGRRISKIAFTIEPKFIDEEKEKLKLYKENGIFDFEGVKAKSGLVNHKFNDKQILELYEIATRNVEGTNITPYDYINKNREYCEDKGKDKIFNYLKGALEKDYARALWQLTIEDVI